MVGVALLRDGQLVVGKSPQVGRVVGYGFLELAAAVVGASPHSRRERVFGVGAESLRRVLDRGREVALVELRCSAECGQGGSPIPELLGLLELSERLVVAAGIVIVVAEVEAIRRVFWLQLDSLARILQRLR